MRALFIAVIVSSLVACGTPPNGGPSDSSVADGVGADDGRHDGQAPTDGLHVVLGSGGTNGTIVDGSGNRVQLHGADRSGSEYACLGGTIFRGPVDQASVTAMMTWKVNVVRVPLNEDCWLGINGVPATSSGQTYRDAIRAYVTLLETNGMYVILELHWAAPGAQLADRQLGMPDADHAPTFWSQVATAYAADKGHVIFDLFNEPFVTDWSCWLVGGMCANDKNNAPYSVAGMASLLKAVRTAGATNVVLLGGLNYSSTFAQWVAKVESIPTLAAPLDGLTLDNLAVSWHSYNFNSSATLCPSQYNGYTGTCASGATSATNYGIPPVLAAGFPVVVGEIGIDAYAMPLPANTYSTTQANDLATWLNSMLTYFDSQQLGYLAWDWNTEASPLLITNFSGTATPYFGVTYKAHLAAL